MARKSTYDQLVESISKRLEEMAPENCETIEEAAKHAETLANAGLAAPSSVEDFSYCPTCKHPCWHGVCQVCK